MRDKCWQCGGKLVRPYFEYVLYEGRQMRVHKICKDDALKAIGEKMETARESEKGRYSE